ncbi:hypothetical protein PCASD_21587 [Puccinia coronata f. sp. avenae]|uniref:Uncharacterized protein n=1 Tax=Puccinia coronata f. sp. avenae TaxID=200324 RepID=A0A2N5UH42_9BASI|nr:hypothetical protein PCASD_21587 [Puccinia coronata f. sp. avenae]
MSPTGSGTTSLTLEFIDKHLPKRRGQGLVNKGNLFRRTTYRIVKILINQILFPPWYNKPILGQRGFLLIRSINSSRTRRGWVLCRHQATSLRIWQMSWHSLGDTMFHTKLLSQRSSRSYNPLSGSEKSQGHNNNPPKAKLYTA